jgi:hypothetical protein
MALVKYNNNSISAITTAGTLATGAMVLIKEQTASSSSTISFVNGTSDVVLDSTYPIYLFKWSNIHPASDGENFTVGFRDGSTAYDATKTTSAFRAYHDEADSGTGLGYRTSDDIAQGTGFQILNLEVDNDADSCCSGEMWLFNPSSTTYVKHFISRGQTVQNSATSREDYIAGYCNVTAAIDAVQFKMSSGNIDAGKIKLYGLKDS